MKTFGVGVIGLGVGEAHARAFAAEPSCLVRWLCDLDAERARRLAADIPSARVAAGLDDILRDPEVDVVAIASYDDAHGDQVIRALDAGKHVFVEKPLARSVAELAAVKAAWQRSRRQLASNLVLRAAPLYRWLRDAIAAGELGRVYAFDGDYLYGRLSKITEGWRARVDDYSVFEGGGIHLVDLMLWLTGERPARVFAAGNRIASAGSAFRYRDYGAAVYECPSGLVGRVTANFGCVHRHQHVVRVFGTEATFIHDDAGARLHESRDPDARPRPIDRAPLAASKGDLVPAFVAGLTGAADLAAETELAFAGVSACAAAEESATRGEPVTITYV